MLIGGKSVIPHAVRDIVETGIAFSARLGPDKHFPSQASTAKALQDCCRPQRVMVLGLSGTGKSSILDALAEERFCSRAPSPTFLTQWCYKPHASILFHEGISTCFFPSDSLLNIDFWDTAGIDKPGVAESLRSVVPSADVVLIILSAVQAENEFLWNYCSSLSSHLATHAVLVLTHSESLSFEKLQQVKENLRTASRHYLGTQLPLYPVTISSERGGEGTGSLIRGVQELLRRIPANDKRIETLVLSSEHLLNEQRKSLMELDRLTKMDTGFLTTIDREIDGIQNDLEAQLPVRLEAYAQYVQDCVPRLGKKAARQLGRFLSIKRLMVIPHFSTLVDTWFFELVKTGLEERQSHFIRDFLQTCHAHWNHVRPQVKAQWDYDIGDFPETGMRTKLEVYKSRMSLPLFMALKNFGIKPCLRRLFADQADILRTLWKIILVLGILAGLLGAFGEQTLAFICLAAALTVWLLGNLGVSWMRYRFSKQIIQAGSEMHIAVSCGLRYPLQETLLSSLADYRKLYSNIRRQVSEGVEYLAPLQKTHQTLNHKMAVIKHRLRLTSRA